jgi:hypothetical protein
VHDSTAASLPAQAEERDEPPGRYRVTRPGLPLPVPGSRLRERIAAVRSPKWLIAFLVWALAARAVWRETARWLDPPDQAHSSAPLADRRAGAERRIAFERRRVDRREGANDMAAWIGAATERRSGRDRRRKRNRRSRARRRADALV